MSLKMSLEASFSECLGEALPKIVDGNADSRITQDPAHVFAENTP
jgi:hypothetical protein